MRKCSAACIGCVASPCKPASELLQPDLCEARCTSNMTLETYRGRAEGCERVHGGFDSKKPEASFKITGQTTLIIAAILAPLQPRTCATGRISRHSLAAATSRERAANERRRRELSSHGASPQRRGDGAA